MSRMLEALRQIEARQQSALTQPDASQQDAGQAHCPEDPEPSPPVVARQNNDTVVLPKPVAEAAAAAHQQPAPEEQPATAEVLAAEEEQVGEETPVCEETPAQECEPVQNEAPAPPELPVSQPVPVESAEPGPEEEPVRDVAAMATTLAEAESAAASTSEASQGPPPAEFRFGRSRSRPSGQQARQYGDLADEILARTETDQPASLLFTSPTDGAGTTEMLASLATALAERLPGEVLAVDGNLPRPALAGRLGVEAMHGLGDVLSGMRTWRDVIRQTVVPDLSVLPGVRQPATGTTLPGQINLRPLLDELLGQYRLVVVDSMSLCHLGTQSIARDCDGTYLVVRLRHTPRRAVQEAIAAVDASGGRLLGCVVVEE